MIDKIREILLNSREVDSWKVNESKIESSELFFIKKELDMNRAKEVHHFKVTVYKDFEEEGVMYKGSSTTNIYPTMSTEEIEKAIESAAFAASFVKNKHYPLVKPSEVAMSNIKSEFSKASISEWLPKVTEAIFGSDKYENGSINSSELFLEKIYTRIINSEGVDVSYDGYKGQIELITNWKEEGEEIELYKDVKFADFNKEDIIECVEDMLKMSKNKAIAKSTPALNNIPVLLSGEPVKEFFSYYYEQANAQLVYEGISTAKVGECIQGKEIKGDKINITVDPLLKTSTLSAPYDEDGYPLKAVEIYSDGILEGYWGNNRFSNYLNIEPTGNIRNIIVHEGSKNIDNLKSEPYLELVAFSDFQMDTMTGDFAGEIRLGWYFDGKDLTPVTAGSISGNIKDVQQKMYFSKEIQQLNNFKGPKTIKLQNVSIAGNE
ncbi:metallopeptidase TldD-related protein [Brassicibacter mesophilus]|uniref:metallopeptidase TldD-related protein n=1 Tax=Brassicibacter mesophilus TaxID=745119 RepID=UPI003D1D1090